MFTALVFAVKSYSAPPVNPASQQSSRVVNSLFSRRVLLAFMCILFGMELGYKICAKRLLYILYPCHVMTAVQVSSISIQFVPDYIINTYFIHAAC